MFLGNAKEHGSCYLGFRNRLVLKSCQGSPKEVGMVHR